MQGTVSLRMRKDPMTHRMRTDYYVSAEGKEYLIPCDTHDFGRWEAVRRAAVEDRNVLFTVNTHAELATDFPYVGMTHRDIHILPSCEKAHDRNRPPAREKAADSTTRTFEGTIGMRRLYSHETQTGRTEYFVDTSPTTPLGGRFRIHEDDCVKMLKNMHDISCESPSLYDLASKAEHACFTVSCESPPEPYYEGWVQRDSLRVLAGRERGKGSHER
jgi:hypothetical protein